MDTLEDVDLRASGDMETERGTVAPLDAVELQAARPARVEIPASHVFSKDKVCKYCTRLLWHRALSPRPPREAAHSRALCYNADVKCTAADGKTWAVAKRYSEFKSLKDRLGKVEHDVSKLPFPKKTWGSGIDEGTVGARTEGLAQWISEVAKMLPDGQSDAVVLGKRGEVEREVCMFLLEDSSLDDLDTDPAARARVMGALGELAAAHCSDFLRLHASLGLSPLMPGLQGSRR